LERLRRNVPRRTEAGNDWTVDREELSDLLLVRAFYVSAANGLILFSPWREIAFLAKLFYNVIWWLEMAASSKPL